MNEIDELNYEKFKFKQANDTFFFFFGMIRVLHGQYNVTNKINRHHRFFFNRRVFVYNST